MLNLAIGEYSTTDVINQLHAKNGVREVKFRYDLLNKYEVKIGELLVADSENSINFNSLANIKRTGIFNFRETELKDVDWLNDRVQPVFLLKMPDGKFIKWPLGMFLLSSPTRKDNFGVWREVEAYDPSVILNENRFDNRYYIQANTKYIDAITTILNSAGIRKVNITNHNGIISIDKEFEIGTSKLEAINQLLSEINFTSIWVDTFGYFTSKPYILPGDRETEYSYKTDDLSITYDGAVNELDLFNVPNKWIITASNPEKAPLTSVYVNDSLNSITSTINRGRVITDFRQIDDIYSQEVLDNYTRRISYNASNIYEKFYFNTCLMPHHDFMNVLYIEYKNLNIASEFIETEWSIDLQAGAKMSHSVRRVINI
ncbi:hypothetical protein [Ruminiclostridium cellobioparum]|uniref:Uncharacterized protein n=1 Tax=Ruminiclostridium cellobioparum subsp. termitidis CT1112 TaxID=1195236 RepID=S0FUR0_RUMCE|nr:hypothetical protein [Ruminiclostridium cellobioparum]EMS74051.1 hypothetical protein CTER_5102 [Ruminiclostridium cellobioparum subsp. termitidis CT1112]